MPGLYLCFLRAGRGSPAMGFPLSMSVLSRSFRLPQSSPYSHYAFPELEGYIRKRKKGPLTLHTPALPLPYSYSFWAQSCARSAFPSRRWPPSRPRRRSDIGSSTASCLFGRHISSFLSDPHAHIHARAHTD